MATAEVYSRSDVDVNTDEVMQQLFELFGNVLDFEVIQSVAHTHKYDTEVTSNALLEMLQNTEVSSIPQDTGRLKPESPAFSYANAVRSEKLKDNADVIIESEKIINCKSTLGNTKLQHFQNYSVQSQQTLKKQREFERIIQHIRQGSRILVFMRGLPGSGKSFLARKIIERSVEYPDYSLFILSTDDYFYNRRTRKFDYDYTKLQEAHEWNQQRAYKQISAGISPVIIDNTNTQMWEMKSYAMMAANFGYIIEILEPFTSWAFDEKQLFLKNSHGVPKVKIKDMLLRYEKNITPVNIFDTYKLSYLNHKPPVLRNFPPVVHTVVENIQAGSTSNELNKSDQFMDDLIGFDDDANLQKPICATDNTEYDKNFVTHSKISSNSDLIDSFLRDSDTNKETILKPNINNCYYASNISNLQAPSKVNKVCPSHNNSSNCKLECDKVNLKDNKEIVRQITKAKDIYPTLNLSSWGLSENAVSSWESWDMVTPLTNTKTNEKQYNCDGNEEVSKQIEKLNSSTNTSSADFSLLANRGLGSNVKIVNTMSRDINVDTTITPPSSPRKKMLLDKSSMTNDYILDAVLPREDIVNEQEHFEELKLLFPTVPFDYLRDIYEKCQKNINWTVDLLLDDSKQILPSAKDKIANSGTPEMVYQQKTNPERNINQLEVDTRLSNHNSIDLRKHIEESIEINKDHYSDHLLKIKNAKHKGGCTNNSTKLDEPSTSKTSTFEVYSTQAGEVIAIHSDVNMVDFEPDIDFPTNEESDEEQTVEINLGNSCVSQLESLFGFPEMFPQGFLPVVQIPLELAGQLHAFYIQSVLGQMDAQNHVLDMIVKEDEELAKKLQMQDDVAVCNGRKTPDLQEIMKEQVAGRLYNQEIDEWKKLSPDTLAAKLTIQKLVNSFPSVDSTVLREILYAHNNSYEQTVEVLLASTDQNTINDPDGNIREPPITPTTLNEMKKANEEKLATENTPDVSKSANEYREEANEYHNKHNEYMQKAQQAFQSKQYVVAQFYSDHAKTYTRLYEQTNSLAATAFLQEHSSRLQNFQTLDLHYLYVKEAIPALDMFLDTNIRLMSGTNNKTENLFIITGRGKRSPGKSRLKPAVIARLEKRGIKHIQLNPGLLKIRIHPHSILTNNLK